MRSASKQADFVTADHGAATLQLLMRDHPQRLYAAAAGRALCD
jgi:hypothetical protein